MISICYGLKPKSIRCVFAVFTTFKTSTQRILSRIRRSFDWF